MQTGNSSLENQSVPYANWPLYIGKPDVPLDVRENVFALALMAAVGSLFAIPGMISYYVKSRSSLALLSLVYVITTTCALMSSVFFEFRSKNTSLVSVYHNASELMFLLFAISKGSLKMWHLTFLGIHITLISLVIVLLPNEKGLSFMAFGIAGQIVDILVFSMWFLLLWENRRNPGSSGQRSGLLLFCIASFLHGLGAAIYGLRFLKGDWWMVVQSALFSIFTVFSIHLTGFAVRIFERAPYDLKWTVAWWKWIPSGLLCIAIAAFILVLKFQ